MKNYQKVNVPAGEARVELHDSLNLTGAEVSISNLPAGAGVPFVHSHKQNEEIYIVLKGEGIITIDGEKLSAKEGFCVNVDPQSLRTIENAGDSELEFICIQTKANSLEQYGLSDAEIC